MTNPILQILNHQFGDLSIADGNVSNSPAQFESLKSCCMKWVAPHPFPQFHGAPHEGRHEAIALHGADAGEGHRLEHTAGEDAE